MLLRWRCWLLLTLVLSLRAGAFTSTSRPQSRPNIILVTLDTTRADRMGFLGSPRGLTPNLDALAKQAWIFSHAYAQVPLTTPSHASILTGTYPQFNHLSSMGDPLDRTLPYLPLILHQRGYQTAAFVGSAILDPKTVAVGFERGFDVYDAGFHNRRHGEDRYGSFERRADVVVDHALSWLNKPRKGPFFLWVHFYDAHDPYDPPEPFKTRYATEPYDGEIAYTDSAVGRLVAALRKNDLLDSALIAVMADHGEAFGEHGERHHGIFLYDETIHVPLLFKLPGQRAGGKVIGMRAGLVDVSPTILAATGIAVPAAMQGESLITLMKPPGTSSASAARSITDRPSYAESEYGHRAFGWSVLRSWRSGKYLYVKAPQPELYDDVADSQASHNLASESKAVSETLAAKLDDFHRKTESTAKAQTGLSMEQSESLRALGYMGSDRGKPEGGDEFVGADPKERIAVANAFHDALVDVENERYQDAVPKLEQLLKDEPGATMAYLELGRAYVHVSSFEKALSPLRKAVELSPQDVLAHYELAQALVKTEHWNEAVPHFQAVVAGSPKSVEMHFYLAITYQKTNQIPNAIKEFKITVQLDPENARANLLLGRLLGMQGQAAQALPYLQKAAKLEPDSAEAHTFLANVYAEMGQAANAQRERAEADRIRSLSKPGAKEPQ